MGEIRIRLRGNARTGEKEILVEYDSDPDQTTLEHERRHRAIVERLIAEGTITREEAPRIIFTERDPARPEADAASESAG